MAAVDLLEVKVCNSQAAITDPITFTITYEVREALKDDIEIKVVYVGSAEDKAYDQVLDDVLLPADRLGQFNFELEVPAPNIEKIPESDLLGVTVTLLTCSYLEKEFVRVGYYLCNEYDDQQLNEEPPARAIISRLRRRYIDDQPRVTTFVHHFDFAGTPADPAEAAAGAEVDPARDDVAAETPTSSLLCA